MDCGIVLANGRIVKDLRGNKFGRLFVAAYAGQSKLIGGQSYWFCMCDCGGAKRVRGTCLTTSVVDNCGCLTRKRQAVAKITHGMHKSPEYSAWRCMIARCHYARHDNFKNYGGRGIEVCEEWRRSFERFFSDMGKKPSPEHSLERIDGSKNYEPGNVRWATTIEQHQNTRSNIIIDLDGERHSIAEWSRITGINHWVIRYRVRNGWDARRSLTTPVGA